MREPTVLPGPSLQFRCSACQRTFSEKRYLKQHIGTNKCERRREFLENTGSFSLALTESPAQPRSLSVSSVNSTRPDAEKVKNYFISKYFCFHLYFRSACIARYLVRTCRDLQGTEAFALSGKLWQSQLNKIMQQPPPTHCLQILQKLLHQ